MKNLKTILLGLFAVISSTEIIYPGFGARQRDDYAYQSGFEAGKNQGSLTGDFSNDQELDYSMDECNGENVEIQALYDEEIFLLLKFMLMMKIITITIMPMMQLFTSK